MPSSRRGDELLEQVLAGANDATANELLSAFFRGYPVEQLRPLLVSDSVDAAKVGAWIASELGEIARPLVDDLVRLLTHESKYVRFFAVDSLLLAAGRDRGDAVAAAIGCIADSASAVRWKTMEFLSRAERTQLVAALPYVQDSELEDLLRQLIWQNAEAVRVQLAGQAALPRRFAVATAGRMALDGNPTILEKAKKHSSSEVAQFAEDFLEMIDPS